MSRLYSQWATILYKHLLSKSSRWVGAFAFDNTFWLLRFVIRVSAAETAGIARPAD